MFSGSLRGRLLWWLLLPLAAFVSISGMISYRNAQTTADLVQDNALLSSTRIIGEDIDWDNGNVSIQIPPAALELFESPEQDSVFYRVEASGHRLLAGSLDLPVPRGVGDVPMVYSTHLDDGRAVRAAAYVRQLYDSGRTEEVVVAVAKTEGSRDAMVWRLLRPQLFGEVLTLVLAMVFVYLGLTFELRPLMKVKDDVSDRNASQLEPIRVARLHVELRPIVEAINQCIARMGQQAATQRQFISDAAHQLRTPLALLVTQIQFARQRENRDVPLTEALAGMHKSSRKLTTLTNKLLLLAQAESAAPANVRERVDLSALIAGVLEELIAFAQSREIDLGAELEDGLYVTGDEALTAALVTNLVDNALRYTQPGGRVTVHTRHSNDMAIVRVIDNGPGIKAEARARVFERFYRASSHADGTGLGLPIVREIAYRQGGTVTLEPGEGGVGLVATVEMRLWSAAV
ncbi:sensor histidine kinase [Paraburkholderia domus]|uniref:histidine kinase n=1 Tax=Paraburkholderia domus TaxID=2793075 RepID=A0A9N8MKA9_9BURK|nr:sensor histidine kinase [Paraburkholderia domus]MBK5049125.1 sensor histidine kinase [Burkholderia sp. R-70006]MBK5060094.1 sensor histidine kinase [Burkholderia sp. R-70199]MBK5118358.1 sensor histidine kinase [Burkholderia sp. R-69980]MBK5164195.1 sensor histidine kinase [Burkholderia sp. R-70211]MBK5179767.1 sensor histidine kinase [Burkholderia sp. R-69749]